MAKSTRQRSLVTTAEDLPSEFREIGKVALAQGWRITKTSRHWQWLPPVIHISHSPGGGNRSVDNAMAALRRAGLSLSAPEGKKHQ